MRVESVAETFEKLVGRIELILRQDAWFGETGAQLDKDT